jgi:cytochrome c-type biogenesis protein CcmH
MKRWIAAAILGLSIAGVAHAAIDTYEFAREADRERFRELTKELRCPKCQNQDIADSNAPIAADLRKEIFRMLGEGKDNQQIIDFMVDRYGVALVWPGRPVAGRRGGHRRDRPPPARATTCREPDRAFL